MASHDKLLKWNIRDVTHCEFEPSQVLIALQIGSRMEGSHQNEPIRHISMNYSTLKPKNGDHQSI